MDPNRKGHFMDRARSVWIYGLPGSGKGTILEALIRRLSENHFRPYEGSELISSHVPGTEGHSKAYGGGREGAMAGGVH